MCVCVCAQTIHTLLAELRICQLYPWQRGKTSSKGESWV